ncbi:hypothetical protein [Robbsia sp. KACC 23696]|uniref:hypothetical protein n=1 Tax=Robbsia sp. KACC 23696 TaxID=3149231 RepID=UPI00325C1A45
MTTAERQRGKPPGTIGERTPCVAPDDPALADIRDARDASVDSAAAAPCRRAAPDLPTRLSKRLFLPIRSRPSQYPMPNPFVMSTPPILPIDPENTMGTTLKDH